MNSKHLIAVLALSSTALLSACYMEDDISNVPPGKYEKSTTSTDAYGTKTERTKSTTVEEDSYGNKRAVVEEETTRDPKGLFNKRTTSEEKKVIEQRNY